MYRDLVPGVEFHVEDFMRETNRVAQDVVELQEGSLRMEKAKEEKEENVKTGQQETKEPWKKPEKSDHHSTKDSPNPRPRRPKDNQTS